MPFGNLAGRTHVRFGTYEFSKAQPVPGMWPPSTSADIRGIRQRNPKSQSDSRDCHIGEARMDLLDIGRIVEPIRLILRLPSALGQSVTSLLFSETGQGLRSLRSNSPL